MKLVLLPIVLVTLLSQAGVDDALKHAILAPRQTRIDTQIWTASKVPVLSIPQDASAWQTYASSLRERILNEVVYRGAARGWREQSVKVAYLGTIRGDGYVIRKLRFEAVPGLHVPALLYEPLPAPSTPTPVVMNVTGHEPAGVATPHMQVRSINLARKGLYALNVEWIGLGQLTGEGLQHYRMNQLDLVGTSGLAVFYESLRRSLDIALGLPHADPTRIAVTGLSGGGWQTIVLSALDTRVTLANPVAGYSSYVTRAQWAADLGDSEQTPSDFAAVADYAHLNALVAPRALQLTFNANDNCCFRADYAAGPMVQMAAPVFRLLGAGDRFGYYVGHGDGHNYDRDNREAFYRFLHRQFFNHGGAFDPREIDVASDLRASDVLATPLPNDNADFRSLALRVLDGLPRGREPTRERLADVVRAHPLDVQATRTDASANAAFWKLRVDHWTVPLVEINPAADVNGTTLVLSDGGKSSAQETARELLGAGRRVAAMDPFYFGESGLGERDFLLALLVSSLGERPLGIQSSQVSAAARWLASRHGAPVEIVANGPRTSLIALVAAALEPKAISRVEVHGGWRTLREVLDRNISAQQMPEVFAFGLLSEFDIPAIEQLVHPRTVVYR